MNALEPSGATGGEERKPRSGTTWEWERWKKALTRGAHVSVCERERVEGATGWAERSRGAGDGPAVELGRLGRKLEAGRGEDFGPKGKERDDGKGFKGLRKVFIKFKQTHLN